MPDPTLNPWDAAKDLEVFRGNHCQRLSMLEPGVKFFVLELEKRGCTTVWSCEGHPAGFSITFRGPAAVARAIANHVGFDVKLEEPDVANGHNGYTISLAFWENIAAYWPGRPPWDDAQRVKWLRELATDWVESLDERIREVRERATPWARAGRRMLALCDDCTDPAGCRSMEQCYDEATAWMEAEDVAEGFAKDGPV